MGYSQVHKGYKCLTPSGKIYISKDVKFNEEDIPYTKLFSTIPNIFTNLDQYFHLHPNLTPPPSSSTPSPSYAPINSSPTSSSSESALGVVPSNTSPKSGQYIVTPINFHHM